LVKRIQPQEIAVINHADLDETAACALVQARVKAVINASPSITGRFPNSGPLVLLSAGIPVLDNVGNALMETLVDGDEVELLGDILYSPKGITFQGRLLDYETTLSQIKASETNFKSEMTSFVNNTLDYARRELDLINTDLVFPQIRTVIAGRHVLVVVRGHHYRQDLQAIKGYVREIKPVVIGVDGGADGLLEEGIRPHMIIGDMDSVSDEALECGAELVVHAYMDGRSPGAERLKRRGLPYTLVSAPGTSEDVAMLLAQSRGAELIVAVGTHNNAVDFLAKGRKGMASTFLTRIKVGHLLVDAKGVSKLYQPRMKWRYLAEIILAAFLPFLLLFVLFPGTYNLIRLIIMRVRLVFNF